jgi:hypothetical protein
VEQAMRDFKEPYYDGADCICCHESKQEVVKNIITMLEEQESVCSDWVIALIKKEYE